MIFMPFLTSFMPQLAINTPLCSEPPAKAAKMRNRSKKSGCTGFRIAMITASPRRAQHVAHENSAGTRNITGENSTGTWNLPWQQLWRKAVTDPRELLDLLDLGHLADSLLPTADTGFAVRVPRGFIARMRRGDPADPLLLQVLPQAAELDRVTGFTRDAVGDLVARAASGVLHKYQGRALLITTGSCAVHCRYCFRRHFPYAEETAAANQWQEAIEHLREDA